MNAPCFFWLHSINPQFWGIAKWKPPSSYFLKKLSIIHSLTYIFSSLPSKVIVADFFLKKEDVSLSILRWYSLVQNYCLKIFALRSIGLNVGGRQNGRQNFWTDPLKLIGHIIIMQFSSVLYQYMFSWNSSPKNRMTTSILAIRSNYINSWNSLRIWYSLRKIMIDIGALRRNGGQKGRANDSNLTLWCPKFYLIESVKEKAGGQRVKEGRPLPEVNNDEKIGGKIASKREVFAWILMVGAKKNLTLSSQIWSLQSLWGSDFEQVNSRYFDQVWPHLTGLFSPSYITIKSSL